MTKEEDGFEGRAAQVEALREALLGWYAACRRDLPWRRTRDPYAIWVSEIMLQQTRVDTVVPYYERFLRRFPTVHALAAAAEEEVLAAWSGLGYYRRARLLHRGARAVAGAGGGLPSARAELLAVPGIGRYTAGAVASIAFGEVVGLVDGNVARVLSRLFGIDDDMRKAGMRRAERLADRLVAPSDPGAFNQALMELGATVCTPRAPRCAACPAHGVCFAASTGRVDELPRLEARAAPKSVRVQAYVLTQGGRVLLARRRPDEAFGGLWEPPRVEGGARVRAAAARDLAAEEWRRVGRVVHVLTHRRLLVDVVVGRLGRSPASLVLPPAYDGARLVASRGLLGGSGSASGLGVSVLAKKVLAAAVAEGKASPPPSSGKTS